VQTTQSQPPLEVSNPNKTLFPADGITKEGLVSYYASVADAMIPLIRDRPLSMRRFPDGIGREGFLQQQAPEYFPDWIDRVTVEKRGGSVTHALANSPSAVAYVANQACVELHVWPSRIDRLDYPDRMIFDLDPSGDDFEPVRSTARSLRALLSEIGLAAFVMSTGSRGLHVVCPLQRYTDFDSVRDFAREICEVVAAREPERLTTEQRKTKRGNRLYLDPFRNSRGQHAIAPYSLRARDGAPVAAPLFWSELEDETTHPRSVTYHNIFERLRANGDPWADMKKHAASPKQAWQKLDALKR
jgi:bifunctional non-homologous end joining protein LigD